MDLASRDRMTLGKAQQIFMADIRFVYFDLGNVLVSFDPALACENVGKLFGISHELAEQVVYSSGLERKLERGELEPEEFASEVRARIADHQARHREALSSTAEKPSASGADSLATKQVPDPWAVSTADLLDAISDMFTPVVSMRQAMDEIRSSQIGIGILSNTCEPHWDWIARQAYAVVDGHFDAHVLSCRVGAMKPDPAIYLAAEEFAGVEPEAILFLDDRSENVHAARVRGWRAEICLGGDPAFEALRRHRVIR